jgi:predicted flavoprotein YhiN
VIVATGGVSYPATGSTGDGYTFAADLGHTVEPVRPSLTPLVSSHPQIGYLDGLLLKNIRAVLHIDCARSSANWASPSAASRVPWRCA